jgi:hypothetical protein
MVTPVAANAAAIFTESFESPVVSGINYGNPASVFNAGAGLEANGGAFGYAAAPDGNQVAHIQNGGTVTLALTGLNATRSYTVSFLAAQRSNYGVLPVNVFFDGLQIGSFTPTSTAFTSVAPFTFTATGGTGSLVFAGITGAGDLNTAIDVVSVSAVPEPATWAMMMLGFGMVGYGLRSRRKAIVATKVSFA